MKNVKMSIKNSILIVLAIGLAFITNLKSFASDNVLQAIQVDGIGDSYNIILRSDDSVEFQKTVQAPNKMILNLKGIRASKSINTIYNNTTSVDSVVVEPTGEDSVKILIQADNVSTANIQFDTLKTPLNVLNNVENQPSNDITLSQPVEAYKPVYNDVLEEEAPSSLSMIKASPAAHYVKNLLKNEKVSWIITFGLFTIMVLSGMKVVRGNDNDIKVGLSQSLKEKELDLYRASGLSGLSGVSDNLRAMQTQTPVANINGLKAYQNGTRSPYMSPEIQRPRVAAPAPAVAAPKPTYEQLQRAAVNKQTSVQRPTVNAAPSLATKPKTTNIDSMKFLESMTKIYEKNGRADLAQGLKTNMKKAKVNLA